MAIFSKWFGSRKQEIKSSGKVLGTSDALGRFLMFGMRGNVTPAEALSLYEQSTAVSIPINKISKAVAALSPVLEIDGDTIVSDHEVIELLKNPSPFYTGKLFQDTLAKYYLITGESLAIALGSINRPPLELQPISPQNRSIIETQGGIAGSFLVSGNTLSGNYLLDKQKNKFRYFDGNLRELKQIRSFSTQGNSLLEGQSLLVSAAAEARQNIQGNKHNLSLLNNGGRMSLLFHFEEDMNQDDFDAAQIKIRERWVGPEKAGGVGVSSGGKLKVEEFGVNNKDMDFAKLQAIAKEAVALQYDVPLPLITTDAQTFNNYAEAKLAFYDDAVLPVADCIYGGLSDFLLPRYGLDPTTTRITYDQDKITALAIRRNEELGLRSKLGLESDNELRAMIGRESYEGGDVIYKPANMIPVGSDLFTEDNKDIPRVIRNND